jgi:signal transduction histidine kinase/CheY-like chemotaxis protein
MISSVQKSLPSPDPIGIIRQLLDESYQSRIHNTLKSIEIGEKALQLSKELDNSEWIAKSLTRLSLYQMMVGEYDKAGCLAEEAMDLFSISKNEIGVADAKYTIASIHYKTNNFHLGLVNLIDCISIYRKFNDYHNLSKACKSLGTIYEYFGDEKNAIKTYEEAIEAGQKTGDPNLESNVYNNLSGIYIKQKNIDKAEELVQSAIKIKSQTGDLRGLAFSLYGRAKVFQAKGNYTDAEKDFHESIEIHLKTGEFLGLGMAYHKIGKLYLAMGQLEKARDYLLRGVQVSKSHNIVLVQYKCFYALYQIYKTEKNTEKALYYLEQYHIEKDSVINQQTLKIIENYELIIKMEANEKDAQMQRAEILKKKEFAEKSAQLKQDFLSTMSHEIRTPLNAVITIASLLSEKRTQEEEGQLLNTLRFSANNLLMIVNDFLDFTKLDVGKASLEYRSVNIHQLFENIRNTYKNLADEKGVRLDLILDEAVGQYYELDEYKMAQIIGNLVTNAIKFTEKGYVEISVKKQSEGEDTDSLYFRVRDTGIGIEEGQLNNIFDIFYQPPLITQRKTGGTGLGLAIVKKLLALHGSSIHASSVQGIGTSFDFVLELKKSTSPAPIPQKTFDSLIGKKVLVAEDNDINAFLIKKLLSKWNMSCEHAKNGIEAVHISEKKTFDFILMDIHMPEMDGFQATRIIKTPGNLNYNTPVFAITADIMAETQEEYQSLFTDFLRKPIEIEKMHEAFLSYSYSVSEKV